MGLSYCDDPENKALGFDCLVEAGSTDCADLIHALVWCPRRILFGIVFLSLIGCDQDQRHPHRRTWAEMKPVLRNLRGTFFVTTVQWSIFRTTFEQPSAQPSNEPSNQPSSQPSNEPEPTLESAVW